MNLKKTIPPKKFFFYISFLLAYVSGILTNNLDFIFIMFSVICLIIACYCSIADESKIKWLKISGIGLTPSKQLTLAPLDWQGCTFGFL